MANTRAPLTSGWRIQAIALVAFAAALCAGWAQAAPIEVYRFYHLDAGRHFYTASTAERDKVLSMYPRFAYEGVAFFAYPTQDADTTPVYRFYHMGNGSHVYTASESEKTSILTNFPIYAYEGIAFYAEAGSANGAIPLYRLYNLKLGTHFFTTSGVEASNAVTTWPWFVSEGQVFFVRAGAGSGLGIAPTASLAAAATQVNVGEMVNLTATVSDADGTVAKVDYYAGTSKIGTTMAAPHTFAYVAPAAGNIIFTAVATDNAGLSGASNSVTVTVLTPGGGPPGNTPPTVSLTTSSTSVAVNSPVTLTAAAVDSDGSIAKVVFYNGATMLGQDTLAPYTYAFSSSNAGSFTLTAVAYDNLNAQTTSNAVTVAVTSSSANQPPTVSLAASPTSVTVGSSTTLTATASDADGTIASVVFMNGTTVLNTDMSPPYTFVYMPASAGTYSVTAVATDNLGAKTTSSVVTVTATAAPAPTGLPRISLGLSATLVAAPSTITLTGTATATASGATVTRVSFYMNGAKLIDDTASPYTFPVTISNPGNYTFYATVTDSLGATVSTLTQVVTAGVPATINTTSADVWRLLNQATFGATQAEAARVNSLGISGWINDQMTQPISGYPDAKYNRIQLSTSADCTTQMPGGGNYPGDSPQAMCSRDHLTLAGIQRDFFTNAISGQDQLRQRVAWALSQILVTSAAEPDLSYAHVMSRYQNLMFQEAFGNFETLLQKVTYNPAMGNYLDSVNNDRPSGARVPNENYAREILQLFTIGLDELNADGTKILDASGMAIPSYDQGDIAEFARVFTGYTYSSAANPAGPATGKQGRYYGAPMVPYPMTTTAGHDPNAKTLLNGVTLPAGQTGKQDIDAAIRNAFLHANTGPYISKQLIQRLVTGNPSPAYVGRVAAKFDNNGSGVRGDLAAVVRAILMDPEARGGVKTASDFGQLKEPVLMVTNMIRALSGVTDGNRLEGAVSNLGQRPYYSPTVFNYFPPDATIPGTQILGPEFAIHTTQTAVNRTNLVYTLVYGGYAPDTTIPASTGTRLFLAQFEPLADNPAAMVSQINKVLAGGQFPVAREATIVTAVNAIPLSATPTAQQRTDRARMAVYLMASSYDYQVQR